MTRPLLLLLGIVAAAGCGKGELDPASLTNNPFDPAYNGPPVFALDTTYVRVISTGSGPLPQQVIGFHARSALFLSTPQYNVLVHDPGQGLTTLLSPTAPGGHSFEYARLGAEPGVPVCITLSLYNDQSAARPEELCATL